MPRRRAAHALALRQKMVELAHADYCQDEVAKEYEPTAPTIRNSIPKPEVLAASVRSRSRAPVLEARC